MKIYTPNKAMPLPGFGTRVSFVEGQGGVKTIAVAKDGTLRIHVDVDAEKKSYDLEIFSHGFLMTTKEDK